MSMVRSDELGYGIGGNDGGSGCAVSSGDGGG